MNKLVLAGSMALMLCSAAFAVEAVTAVHGTIAKIDAKTKTIVVKTEDGTERTLHVVGKTAVRGADGTKDGAKDAFNGLKEGSEVVAQYTTKGANNTAVEVDRIGKDGLQQATGTITQIDQKSRTIAVKTADGSVQTFKMANSTTQEQSKKLAAGTEKSAHVTVYYTQEAGKRVAHFFERH
jgi:uncharacterized protein with beta-barrel porin domain